MNLFRRRKPTFRAPLARRVRDLEVLSARLIRAGFAGDYHSAFHGRGIEFSQVREYQPGDDVRTIDWNVTARSGVPHVKEFIEERDLTVLVAIDVSGSMAFGRRTGASATSPRSLPRSSRSPRLAAPTESVCCCFRTACGATSRRGAGGCMRR